MGHHRPLSRIKGRCTLLVPKIADEMAGEDLYLGIDAGTQSTKAILYNPRTKTVLGRGSYAHELLYTTVAGRAEQHPSSWIQVRSDPVAPCLSSYNPPSIPYDYVLRWSKEVEPPCKHAGGSNMLHTSFCRG